LLAWFYNFSLEALARCRWLDPPQGTNPGLQLSKYLKFYNLLIAIADADFAKDSPSVPPMVVGAIPLASWQRPSLTMQHAYRVTTAGITKDEMIQVLDLTAEGMSHKLQTCGFSYSLHPSIVSGWISAHIRVRNRT
jgi:hypothetical protein